MFSDYLTRVKLAINEVAKATTEPEVYRYLAETLVNHLSFNRATVRKVNWEENTLSLVCYVGFTEVPTLKLPLSEEIGAMGKATLRGEGMFIFDEEEISPELRSLSQYDRIQKEAHTHSFAVIPVKVKGLVRVVFEVDRMTSGGRITPRDKEILDLFSETVGTTLERVFAQEELKAALIRDELTGLFNRRYFMNRLSEEYERAKRYGIPLSLCIFDIDNFKLINDTYGHIFGDQVLRQIGRLISGAVRHVDIAARYGGEEFTILFTHTTLEDAAIIAERIHRNILNLIFPHDEKGIQVTATFGISTYSPVNIREPKELLHQADMALYEGKRQYSKNCLVIYTGSGYEIIQRGEIRLEPYLQTKSVEPWKTLSLHLYKNNSFALLILGVVLPIIILFAFYYGKGYKNTFPIHGISTPDNGSNQIGLALIETPPLGAKSKDDTFFEENLISSKQKIQRISNKPRTGRKERLLAKRKIHLRPYSLLTATKGKKGRIFGSEFVLALNDERGKELLAQQLRMAFLLAYY